MKKTLNVRRIKKLLIAVILCFIVIAIIYTCKSSSNKNGNTTHINNPHFHQNDSQLVIFRTPNSSMAEFHQWLHDTIESKYGNVRIGTVCGNCEEDSSLLLLYGPGAVAFITAQSTSNGGNGSKQPTGTGGGAGTIYWAKNTTLQNFEQDTTTYEKLVNNLPKSTCSGPSVIVAVFDTGIDTLSSGRTHFTDYMYNGATFGTSCLGAQANNGWNFAGNPSSYIPNGKWNDDDPKIKHGTIVSRIILDRVLQGGKNCVSILPVKILKDDATSTLFNLLCGLVYARNRGAKIINASLGYYDSIGHGAPLLREFIKNYLTKNNILLVCAAGNQFDSAITRDLRKINFYPASLSDTLPNVISVTTVMEDNGSVSNVQNYSNKKVDIGVNGDKDLEMAGVPYKFHNPLLINGMIRGSSFATPCVTAALCSNYSEIENLLVPGAAPLNKDVLMGILKSKGVIHKGIKQGLDSAIINRMVL